MIKVTVTALSDDSIVKIVIKDHADKLICAGVSCCLTGAINAIDDISLFDYDVKEGDSYIKAKSSINSHDKVVLETLYIQLLTIANKYKKEIKIFRERV